MLGTEQRDLPTSRVTNCTYKNSPARLRIQLEVTSEAILSKPKKKKKKTECFA